MAESSKNYYSTVYTGDEWEDKVNNCSIFVNDGNYKNLTSNGFSKNDGDGSRTIYKNGLSTDDTIIEPSVPKLLLNYFITMAYESASIRMAKELGITVSNRDIKDFLALYKIEERSKIILLIKKGEISRAIEEINTIFGIEVLELDAVEKNQFVNKKDDDLHFKLLLLNLIEMIRNHNIQNSQNPVEGNDVDESEFIMNLVEYGQDKLILKVSSNEEYMKELELVMTLLLFPLNGNGKTSERNEESDKEEVKLPSFLSDYYSLSLRSRIAEAVNRRLLKVIHPSILKRSDELARFPDLLSTDNISKYQNNVDSEDYKPFLLREQFNENNIFNPDGPNDNIPVNRNEASPKIEIPVFSDDSSRANYWTETKNTIRNEEKDTNHEDMMDTANDISKEQTFPQESVGNVSNLSDIQYESKLIKLMKLWCWCENELHRQDIGVPRVETNI